MLDSAHLASLLPALSFYDRYKVTLRNLGRSKVTGSFTEENLEKAFSHNQYLSDKWHSYAISEGDKDGWNRQEEHEKIRQFLEKLLKEAQR